MASPRHDSLAALPAEVKADDHDWLLASEVAEHFRTNVHTIRFWTTTGKIKGARVGRSTLYPRSEIQRLDQQLRDEVASK